LRSVKVLVEEKIETEKMAWSDGVNAGAIRHPPSVMLRCAVKCVAVTFHTG